MSPSSLDICNYSVNCMRGLDEVLLAWRVGDRGAAAGERRAAAAGLCTCCSPGCLHLQPQTASWPRSPALSHRAQAGKEFYLGGGWGGMKRKNQNRLLKEVALRRDERRLAAARGKPATERGAKEPGKAGSILMQRQQPERDPRLAKFQCKSRGARGMGLG